MRAMPTWLWRALALGSIAAALAFALGDLAHYGPPGNFGFDFHPTGTAYRVTHVDPGEPADRAGIRIDDRVAPGSDLADKVHFFYPSPPGVSLKLTVALAAATRNVSLRSEFPPRYSRDEAGAQRTLFIALQCMKVVFFLVAALIVVRRADAPAARALAAFLIALAIGTVNLWPWYPPPIAVIVFAVRAMAVVFAFTQAIRFATVFPQPSRVGPRAAVARMNACTGVAIVVAGVATLSPILLKTVPATLVIALQAAMLAFGIYVVSALAVAFVCGWREADSLDRERVRWIALSTGVGLGGFIVTVALQALGVNDYVAIAFVFSLAAIPIGTAYAILRHRMLDIGFVVNRALVFGAISALVVAAFSLLEFVLGRYVATLGHVQSALLEALLALAIGVSLGNIHRRVDTVVDAVFFRARHDAEASLRRLTREAAYVDDPHVLAGRVVAAVDRHAAASGTAVYLDGNGRYTPFLSTLPRPEIIDRNDPAIVRMRAAGEPVDVEALVREAGPTACPGAMAFPMIVRGQLVGILACGSKTNMESYAPDEAATLAELAHASGLAFDTIQTSALQRAVDRTLSGDGDLEELRRARSML